MEAVSVPAHVAEAVCQRWPDHGAAWCSNVGGELAELCARFHAIPIEVMHARYGFVVAVGVDGNQLVMRASPDPDGPFQGAVAISLAELGVAPRVHDFIATDNGTWLIADRVMPGTPLATINPEAVGEAELAAVFAPISGQPAPLPNMPRIADWLADRLDDDHLIDIAPGRTVAPLKDRQNAASILSYLSEDCEDGLCHGDSSGWNILQSDSRFALIDPRGMAGEVAYDLAVMALKAARTIRSMDLASSLAHLVGVDAERVHAWMVVADAARV